MNPLKIFNEDNRPEQKSVNIEYTILEKDVVGFAEGVQSVLLDLGYDFAYDETSPPDKNGEVTYKVFGVKKEVIDIDEE